MKKKSKWLSAITVASLAEELGLKVRAIQMRARKLAIEPVMRADGGSEYLFTEEQADDIRQVRNGRPRKSEEELTRSAKSHRKRREKS